MTLFCILRLVIELVDASTRWHARCVPVTSDDSRAHLHLSCVALILHISKILRGGSCLASHSSGASGSTLGHATWNRCFALLCHLLLS